MYNKFDRDPWKKALLALIMQHFFLYQIDVHKWTIQNVIEMIHFFLAKKSIVAHTKLTARRKRSEFGSWNAWIKLSRTNNSFCYQHFLTEWNSLLQYSELLLTYWNQYEWNVPESKLKIWDNNSVILSTKNKNKNILNCLNIFLL